MLGRILQPRLLLTHLGSLQAILAHLAVSRFRFQGRNWNIRGHLFSSPFYLKLVTTRSVRWKIIQSLLIWTSTSTCWWISASTRVWMPRKPACFWKIQTILDASWLLLEMWMEWFRGQQLAQPIQYVQRCRWMQSIAGELPVTRSLSTKIISIQRENTNTIIDICLHHSKPGSCLLNPYSPFVWHDASAMLKSLCSLPLTSALLKLQGFPPCQPLQSHEINRECI